MGGTMKGPKKSFCTLVDEAQLRKHEEEKTKPSPYYPLRPSSAGYCSRKLAYELASFEGLSKKLHEDRPANVIRLLSLGTSVEWHTLKYLEQSLTNYKIKYKQQVVSLFNLPTGRLIEGSMDAVMVPTDGTSPPGVLDVKSKGDGWSAGYRSRWEEEKDRYSKLSSVDQFEEDGFWIADPMAFLNEVGEDALVSNICQINLYIGSAFMQERKADWGSILRYNKNNSKHIEVRFAYSQELFDHIKKKFSDIEHAVLMDKNPNKVEKEFILGSQACSYCPYQVRCWPDASAKKEYYKSLPKKTWATKVAELEGRDTILGHFAAYDKASKQADKLDVLEAKILKEMESHDVKKIQLEDGRVYEMVFLKSPKPHLELRRSKW